MKKKTFYITTPIYYPNAKPHVGTLYSTLIADVQARWHKLMGHDVFFLTGTDEHGQKLQEQAEAAGMSPKKFIDTIVPVFKELWKLYNIEYNRFIRTTDADHEETVKAFLEKLIEQGDIYKSTYTGWYCVPCERFVTVGSDSVKDDKGNYLCPECRRVLRELSEESYFFRLSAYEDNLLKFYEENPDFVIPKERLAEVVSFVKSGLKDLSISRKTVKWGIPFPGDPEHTIYVWGDALLNYLSGIGYGKQIDESRNGFDYWWPADIQIMAKDIFRFHAVYWPALLMAVGLPLPKKLLVHGYVLFGDKKMSKSLGNVVEPMQLASKYGIDQVRYYLIRQIPVTHDGCFDIDDLENHINSDLANNLGNLVNRMITLALNNGLQEVNPVVVLEPVSVALKEKCDEAFRACWEEMNKCYFHMSLSEVFRFVSEVNAYFHAQQPWVLAKKNKAFFAEVISSVCHSLHSIALMLWPVMPDKMEDLLGRLGIALDRSKNYEQDLRTEKWDKTFRLSNDKEPLFPKLESKIQNNKIQEKKSTELKEKEIDINDFAKIQLAVGKVLSCESVPKSEKLYKLEVDLGEMGKRQILSGVAQHLKPEDLIGKQGVFVINLKPRKVMGLESQGMMLFSDDNEGTFLPVVVDGTTKLGSRVS